MPVTRRRSHRLARITLFLALGVLSMAPRSAAGDAPSWMHALTGVTLPSYDEKTNAVQLFSDTSVTVLSADKIKTRVREAYKILRPDGRSRGTVGIYFNRERKINYLRGWCIPAQGKDFEVKEKDAADVSAPIEGGELVSDVRYRFLQIPAPDPGNIIGYEYETEEQPFWLQDVWRFQESVPVREAHYSLHYPAGWEFKSSWLSYPEVKAVENGPSAEWVVSDVKGIRSEPDMPPFNGVAGQMIVSFIPPGGSTRTNNFVNWQNMGSWYAGLYTTQLAVSDQIKQEVARLVAGNASTLAKMQAIARFAQHDVRYVAIELGIGGWQPHPAADVYTHRYGDCKDKATLMAAMLHEIGIDSYHVVINAKRGSVGPDTPAYQAFNHVILAVKLPDDVKDPSLIAVVQHPRLGRILFFDPTNEFTPFGEIGGYLQSNYGLLVTPQGGELFKLPQQPASMNSIQRTGHLTIDLSGTLQGNVEEVRLGDRAASERARLRSVNNEAERIKPIENVLAGSLSSFHIVKASVANLARTDQPFGFSYSFLSDNYAKSAGGLMLVRPRVVGTKSSAILETKEPRKFPLEFDGPSLDTDTFDIALPAGYEVDDVPPPMDADFSFGSYHSRTEARGQTLHYSRTVEIRELSVPLSKMDDLKKFYRIIATDERNTAVLKPSTGSH